MSLEERMKKLEVFQSRILIDEGTHVIDLEGIVEYQNNNIQELQNVKSVLSDHVNFVYEFLKCYISDMGYDPEDLNDDEKVEKELLYEISKLKERLAGSKAEKIKNILQKHGIEPLAVIKFDKEKEATAPQPKIQRIWCIYWTCEQCCEIDGDIECPTECYKYIPNCEVCTNKDIDAFCLNKGKYPCLHFEKDPIENIHYSNNPETAPPSPNIRDGIDWDLLNLYLHRENLTIIEVGGGDIYIEKERVRTCLLEKAEKNKMYSIYTLKQFVDEFIEEELGGETTK